MSDNPIKQFQDEREERIKSYANDDAFIAKTREWEKAAYGKQYVYNFEWMGRPVIQYPQDIVIMQELIWNVNPDVIVEIGVAHGGSILFSASILELRGKPDSYVVGVDVDIRAHNRAEIEKHPMYKRVKLVEGSSIAQETFDQVMKHIPAGKKVLVILDSMHTHDHVLKELQMYAPIVSPDSYVVVQDTHVEDLPNEFWDNRPWGHGNSPKTAVFEFLKQTDAFEIDPVYETKAMITCAKSGFLKRVK